MNRLHSVTAEEIAQRLRSADNHPEHEQPLQGLSGQPREAAVLLPLFRDQNQWHLLFIRRAECEQDRHSGEVAFPGGRVETCDSNARATALRESREEIGLDPEQVRLLGDLPAFRTASNYLVTPVVGHIPWPLALRRDPREVARVFSIPLAWLAEPANHQVRDWLPPGQPAARRVIFFQEFSGERLWGVSARITLSLVRALSRGAQARRDLVNG